MTGHDHLPLKPAVDITVLTVRENYLNVLVIDPDTEPYLRQPSVPGGFVRAGGNLRAPAERELSEENGLDGAALSGGTATQEDDQ